jgi:hypothetical protein
VTLDPAACHVRPAGPRPGCSAQPRKRPATRRNGDALDGGAVGLAGGKVPPASTGGFLGWRRAGGVEVGLTLAAARREGAERRRRCRGDGRCRGSGGSGERRGGPVARAEARDVVAAQRRSGEGKNCGAGEKIRPTATTLF